MGYDASERYALRLAIAHEICGERMCMCVRGEGNKRTMIIVSDRLFHKIGTKEIESIVHCYDI